MSLNLGSFEFTVDANASAAQRKIEAFVRAAEQGAKQVEQAFAGINITGGTIKPKVDTKAAEDGVERLERRARQLSDRPSTFTVRANFNEATEGLDQLAKQARELGNARFNLKVDVSDAKHGQQAVEQLAATLKQAKAGDTINLDVQAATVKQGTAAVKELDAAIRQARADGARVNVNVQTNANTAGFAQQAGRGFIQQITPGLATGAAAATGVLAAQGVVATADAFKEATAAGIRYNAFLETAGVQFKVFTGSAEEADEALKRLRKNADITPFNTEEVVRSGQIFAQVAGGNIDKMERLVNLAEQLAAVNPNRDQGGGLEGGTIAVREALSGDFTSAQRRFNVDRGEIQKIRDAGLSGEALAEALVKAAHGSQQLLDSLGGTFDQRLSTAESHLKNLAATATKPTFDVLSAGLAAFNNGVESGLPRLRLYADILGRIGPGLVANAIFPAPVAAGLQAPLGALTGVGTVAPAIATGLGPGSRAHQEATGLASSEIDAANAAVEAQNTLIDATKKKLEAVQLAAKEVTAEYERQLRPLEDAGRGIDASQRANDARQRDIAQRQEAAGPPVAVRAQAAAATVLLDHEQALTDARHRRAELSEQIARAEEQAATRGIEAQIRGQEQALQALQARVQAENQARAEALDGQREEARTAQEARQTALEGTREEARGRQELRQTALDGLRDLISAQQEQRRDALEGIQDEIRARRQQYDDRRTATQELSRLDHEAFEDTQHDNELVHQQYQQDIQDRLDGLRALGQEAERQQRRKSDAERELAAFNASQTEIGRQRQLDDARRAIGQARTGRELRAASLSYSRTVQDVAAERHRDELQARIAREKEASDKRREQIQDKITKLEQKARADDREYQRVRQANEEEERQRVRNEQLADRAAEKAERELRRQEDDKVREQQRKDHDADKADQQTLRDQQIADREADRKDQAAIRAQEQADREATKKEQAGIRAQEQADREADRKAQREILGIQQGIAAARNALADRKDAFETVLDAAALARLREQAALEERRLTIRQGLLDASDPARLAQLAGEKVIADEVDRILAARKAIIDGQTQAIKDSEAAALEPVKADERDLEIQIGKAKALVEQLEKRVDAARQRLADLNSPPPGLPGGPLGPPLPAGFTPSAIARPGTATPIQNADGSVTTERSITVTEPDLNGGRATNIPSVWEGRVVSDLDAIENAIKAQNAGIANFPSFDSIDEAVAAAEQRTNDLGAGRVQSIGGASGVGGRDPVAARDTGTVFGPEIPSAASAQAAADEFWSRLLSLFSPTTAHAEELDGQVDAITVDVGTHWGGVADQIDAQQQAIEDALARPFDPDGVSGIVAAAVTEAAIAWGTLVEQLGQDQEAIEEALAAPFNAEGIAGLVGQAEQAAAEAWAKIAPDIAAQAPTVGAAEAQLFDDAWAQGGAAAVDATMAEVGNHWATVGDQIDSARNRQAVEQAITDLFGPNVLNQAFGQVDRNMGIYGNNAAVAWIDGWTRMMSQWQPYVPAAQSGGSGGYSNTGYSNGGYSGSPYSAASDGYASGAPAASMSSGLKGQIERYIASLGYDAADVQRYGALMLRDYDLLSAAEKARIAQYAQGTNYVPNDQLAFLHRGEAVIPAALNRPAGSVMPPGLMGSGVAVAAGVGGGWSGGGAPQVHFHFEKDAVTVTSTGDWGAVDRGMLEERLQRHGNEVMDDLVDILHASQRHAPRRSDRDLGGAR